MQKSKIEWCDETWNPVTGCLNGCEYCYARRTAKRFGTLHKGPQPEDEGLTFVPDDPERFWELDEPMRNEAGKIEPYPANFYPTLHRYRMGEPVYIASWSGGKDSTATIILAHEHGEPLDLIIFSEVMFDRKTSGELPEHIDFVKNKAIPLFESWGYEVRVLHARLNYLDIFMREPTRGKRAGLGMKTGFPMSGRCQINRSVKVEPIEKFLKTIKSEYKQYIGIAADEPKRLARLEGTNKTSLLAKYGIKEQAARELCEKYGLLSPVYGFAPRGGCWFCPNARRNELKNLRYNHPDLWRRLLDLENMPDLIGKIWNSLEKRSIHDWEEAFQQEDAQLTLWD